MGVGVARSEGRRAAMRVMAAAPLLLDVPAGVLRMLATGTAELLLSTHSDAGTTALLLACPHLRLPAQRPPGV